MVELKTIDQYIGVCWETIARFIVDQPLFALCKDRERKRGSTRCMFLWEQPLSLDNAGAPLGDEEDEGRDDLLLG